MPITIEFLYEDGKPVKALDNEVLDEDKIKSILKLRVHDIISLGSGSEKRDYMVLKINHRFISAQLSGQGEDGMYHEFIVRDRVGATNLAIGSITRAWDDIEKLTPEPPPISVAGTPQAISQQISPQPAAGSTARVKRKWIYGIMEKTAPAGFEFEGFTVSIFPPGLSLKFKKKPSLE